MWEGGREGEELPTSATPCPPQSNNCCRPIYYAFNMGKVYQLLSLERETMATDKFVLCRTDHYHFQVLDGWRKLSITEVPSKLLLSSLSTLKTNGHVFTLMLLWWWVRCDIVTTTAPHDTSKIDLHEELLLFIKSGRTDASHLHNEKLPFPIDLCNMNFRKLFISH